jgi:hypothetical protein
MRAILALTVVGAVSVLTSVATMASQQTPKQTQQPSNPPRPDQIDSVRTPTDERSLVEFWTPDRLRDAQPMPMPRVDPKDIKDPNK